MKFGIMFFSSSASGDGHAPYRLLMDAARFADTHGFSSVWTPERHFHPFGGLFPNPAVTSAALAATTERIQLRAGSLISPLHDPIRIAEEWSVVDNLSGGRVGISFGAGWNVNDFVFFPERYEGRRALMFEQIATVQRLWRGEVLTYQNGAGTDTQVSLHPQPVQDDLPIWVTSSGNLQTFTDAGAMGANMLTHLIGQDIDTLRHKIASYRDALEAAGHDRHSRVVTLMLHTFLGTDPDQVLATVREPFREYLRSAVKLELSAAAGGGVISGGMQLDADERASNEAVTEQLLDLTFERYYRTGALMGTPAECRPLVARLIDSGVDEIACLVDFLPDHDAVLAALPHLDELRQAFSADAMRRQAQDAIDSFTDEL